MREDDRPLGDATLMGYRNAGAQSGFSAHSAYGSIGIGGSVVSAASAGGAAAAAAHASAAPLGVVYCCVQPAAPGASNFEWSSLDDALKAGCRRVVQRIYARLQTTAHGERRQFSDDTGRVQLFSIIGSDRCIFVTACMRREFRREPAIGHVLDRLLLNLKREFALHISGALCVGSHGRITTASLSGAGPRADGGGGGDDDAGPAPSIDDAAMQRFDAGVRAVMDTATATMIDLLNVRAALARSGVVGGGGGRGYGPPNDTLGAAYIAGPGGASDEPFVDDANSSEEFTRSAVRDIADPAADAACCSTRTKFVCCFVLAFVGAALVFVLTFVCKRHETSFSCG
jgi:hypothetical protein